MSGIMPTRLNFSYKQCTIAQHNETTIYAKGNRSYYIISNKIPSIYMQYVAVLRELSQNTIL